MNTLEEKLLIYAKNSMNVMLIGRHGVGKSAIVKRCAERTGLRFKYYSSATLDPFSELIGIPVPDTDHRELKNVDYFRPKDLNNAEFIFFDELNRVQNPRVLNAVLEIVQFKTINGEPLPSLKMVWAAINPPGDYQVEELDPALEDRFHVYVRMQAEVDIEYMKSKMPEPIARTLKEWWDIDLSDDQRKVFTPRRIEYLGCMISNNIPWRDSIPIGTVFPIQSLEKRLDVEISGKDKFVLTKENVLKDVSVILEKVKAEPQLVIGLSSLMTHFTMSELFECKDVLNEMPTELVNKIMGTKFSTLHRVFAGYFVDAKIDIVKTYPKIAKALAAGIV